MYRYRLIIDFQPHWFNSRHYEEPTIHDLICMTTGIDVYRSNHHIGMTVDTGIGRIHKQKIIDDQPTSLVNYYSTHVYGITTCTVIITITRGSHP